MSPIPDLLGTALRCTPKFRGKWRVQRLWERRCFIGNRLAVLPDGSKVRVDLNVPYERMVWLQVEEWDELCYLRRKLNAGDVFVDAGANIGIWTLVAASVAQRVYSFEPNPAIFTKLTANISLNRRESVVTAFQNAVSDKLGTAVFSCEHQHNLSSIVSESSRRTVEVKTAPIDSICSSCAGIKIDTEGHKLAALRGAERVIKNGTWLIVEFNTTLLPSACLRDWGVFQFLTEFGYRPFIYNRKTDTPIDGYFEWQGYRNILFQRIT